MSSIILASDRIANPGQLKPDEDGYYKVILGTFNVYNANGVYYPMTDAVREALKENSTFYRQITNGALKGEVEHPEWDPTKSKAENFKRQLYIDPNNVSHAIRKVEIVEDGTGPNGEPILIVYGWVKPFGPKKDILKESLEDPYINTAFSVRSIAKLVKGPNGIMIKQIVTLTTWDFVNEPGMEVAKKSNWITTGNESRELDEDDIREILSQASIIIDETGNESEKINLENALDVLKQCTSVECIYETWL
jgi:hypothetical protein